MSFRLLTLCGLWLVGAALVASPVRAADPLELLKQGELTCGVDGGYAPFSLTNEKGEFDGLEVRVMKEMARRLGLQYKPVVVKFDAALIGLQANQFDLLCNSMDITAARQEQVRFLDGWLQSGARLAVRKESPVKTAADFNGVVGVLSTSTFAKIAETKLHAKEIKTYKSEGESYIDLTAKNIDGVVSDSIAISWAIQKGKLPLRLTDGYLSTVQKGWAIRKDKPNLAKALNAQLAAMIKDGTYQKMTSELIGYSPNPDDPIRSQF